MNEGWDETENNLIEDILIGIVILQEKDWKLDNNIIIGKELYNYIKEKLKRDKDSWFIIEKL